MKEKKVNYDILLLIVVVIWGAGFVAVENALNIGWTVSQIMTSRFLISSIVMKIVFYDKLKHINKKEWIYGITSGIFLFLAFYLQTYGQKYTNISNVAFFTAINVVLIPFFSWFLLKNKVTFKIFGLALLAFLGMTIISFNGQKIEFKIGDIIILFSAIFFALQIAFIEKANLYVNPIKINFIQLFTAFLLSFITMINTGMFIDKLIFVDGIPSILYIGVFSTCVCYFLQTYAQKYTSATNAGIILSLEGFFGSMFAIILGYETFKLNIFVGGMIIVISAIISSITTSVKGDNNV